jgi:hypothetical protein
VLPRGAGGRIEPSYYANLSLSYAYPLPGELELEFTARLANLTNNKAVLRVDETYSNSFGRAIAGGDLEDLKHSKVQNPNAPTSFFQRIVLPKQGNFGVQTVFQQPIQASSSCACASDRAPGSSGISRSEAPWRPPGGSLAFT